MPDASTRRAALAAADALAAEIRILWNRRGRIPPDRTDIPTWRLAIHVLLQGGEFEAATFAVKALNAVPAARPMQTLERMLDLMPRATPHMPFVDDLEKEIQIVRRPDATTTLLVFGDINHAIGMPLVMGHRWFARLGMNVIYLRDFRNLCFSSGVRSLAPSRGETVRALRRILATLGARRIVCYGNSVGGFAAVHYAADLGADAAVSLAGPTDLTALRSPLGQRLRMMNAEKDLNRILSEAEAPPQVLVVCGDGNWDDRLQAENLAGQPTATVRLVEQFGGHSVAAELICRQQFGAVLEWLAGTTRADPRTMPALPYAPWRPAPA